MKSSPHFPDILISACSSALVLPILTMAMGLTASTACKTILYPENVVNDDPRISKESAYSTSFLTVSTTSLLILSPKNTISGFKIPPQLLQGGTLKFAIWSWKLLKNNALFFLWEFAVQALQTSNMAKKGKINFSLICYKKYCAIYVEVILYALVTKPMAAMTVILNSKFV